MAQKQRTFKCNIKPTRVTVSKNKRTCNIEVIKKSDLTGSLAISSTKTEFCNEILDSVGEENETTHSNKKSSICDSFSLHDDINVRFDGKANQTITQSVPKKKRTSTTSYIKATRKRKADLITDSLVNSTSKTEFCNEISDSVGVENTTTHIKNKLAIDDTFSLLDNVNERLNGKANQTNTRSIPEKKRTSNIKATTRKANSTGTFTNCSLKAEFCYRTSDAVSAENKNIDCSKKSLICKTYDLRDDVKSENEFDFNEKLKETTVQTFPPTLAQKKRTSRSNVTRKRKSVATNSLADFSNEIKLYDCISDAIELKNEINDSNEISNYKSFDILKNTTEKNDLVEKSDKVTVKPCSQEKFSNHLSKSSSSLNLISNLSSIIDKVKNLELQPSIHIYTIMPEGKGLSAVDVSQNLLHLAFSFPHSHEIHLCARKSLSSDITRNDIRSTWLNFASARNQLNKVERSEKGKSQCLSTPQNYIFNHTEDVSGLRFSSDGNLLLSCSLDGSVKVISTDNYQVLEHYNGYGVFTDIDVNTRSTQFVTTSSLTCKPFYAVYVYDFERKNPVTCFCGHENSLKCVRFHPNGLYIATAATDNCIKLWSVHQNKEVRSFKDEGLDHPQKITFSPDGKYIASTHSGCVKIWDIASSRKLKSLEISASESCKLNICYNYSGSMLAAGGSDKKIHIWNSTTYESSEVGPHYDLLKSECLKKSIFSIKYVANFFSCVTG